MVETAGQRRFRLSIRTLMIAVALCAVLLALAVWTIRQFEARVRLERMLAHQARDQAALAIRLARVRSAQAALVASELGSTDQPKAGRLWAGLSVNHAIFKSGQTKDLRIEFTLVNDGDKVIDPKIAGSQTVINGKERTDSGVIFNRVQNGDRFKALSPSETLQFSFPLGDQFKEPGTIEFLGTALVSTRQNSCSESCLKEPADLIGQSEQRTCGAWARNDGHGRDCSTDVAGALGTVSPLIWLRFR